MEEEFSSSIQTLSLSIFFQDIAVIFNLNIINAANTIYLIP